MKRAFRRTAFVLMRELSWRCFGHKIDWRRFFVLVAILTVSAFVFQTLVHAYLALPNRPLHSPHQSNSSLQGGRLQKVHLTLTDSVISPNASNKLIQSFSVQLENAELEAPIQRKNSVSVRKKDKNLAGTTKVATSLSPPRHVPKQVEVDETLNLLFF